MERLLIHPPFADPTQPYLSLPALKGYLRSRQLDAMRRRSARAPAGRI